MTKQKQEGSVFFDNDSTLPSNTVFKHVCIREVGGDKAHCHFSESSDFPALQNRPFYLEFHCQICNSAPGQGPLTVWPFWHSCVIVPQLRRDAITLQLLILTGTTHLLDSKGMKKIIIC